MTCPWAHHDGAYLLGALPAEERRPYEDHLPGCASCTAALSEVAGLPGLLGRVPADALEAPELPPADLLPNLLAAVAAERKRARWRSRSLAALAAAAALVAALLLLPVFTATAHRSTAVAMAKLRDVPIQATAALVDKPWGTEVDLRCTYTGETRYAPGGYVLVAIARDGSSEQIATWRVVAGRPAVLTASTSLRRSEIRDIEVRTPAGEGVLRLRS
ncbi:MAG: zf-HC2 domain-containing protein [Actinomycetota bacterium]|nr:zf-HC2 domain-containing protein [Actinomycetota bacterium]